MSENVAMAANVQGPTRKYICCVPVEAKPQTVTLGSVYGAVVKLLKARGWRRIKKETQRPGAADLILGGPCGAGIPWKALRVHRTAGTPPLTSFYRSFEQICRKGLLARTLRKNGGPENTPNWFPTSYIVAPGREEADEERALLRNAHVQRGGDGVAVWILKPSDGGKGANIKVMDTLSQIEAHFDALEAGSIAWVASEYIKKPLLLQPGSRKFDVRIWALLDANYDVHVWNNGVLRTCSVPFTLDASKLDDPFVHLSNHCIQTRSETYGKHESATNEVWLKDFDAYLKQHHNSSVEALAGQWRSIIKETLDAAREFMEVDKFEPPYNCFQVFGFDFMVDSALKVWLVEVNSSPAIAEALADEFAKDVVSVAVDAYLGEECGETAFVRVESSV